jgi:hypothetical protein
MMTCKYLMPAVFLVAVCFTVNLAAQNKKLTLEDIYTNGIYREKGIGQLRWMKDNKSYSMLAYNSTAKGYDIVRYDVESGTKSVLVSANQLLPAGAVKPLLIEDYTWSDDNKEGYREGSPVTHAKKLQGNLLIMHGTGDDNVHYQNFEVLVNELIKHNKLFSMMSYPMRDHGIYQGVNTTLQMRRTMEQYWKKNL